ncbi:hypothetical protein MN116_002384 [Schistosoma mekongi]|uniref:Ethanolaminephosphotransferase n=1 Tax=Schistosoma mekongi TaxID=38744 RepID=A0AAE2D8S7_SCHME|nr:hypothetical protein MN116_002384 [Schistosoma mekongi]
MHQLSDQMISGLKTYKYSCIDNSPFSIYIMHPFWDWLAKFYPVWLAPNLITFIGFLLTVAHYFLLCYYNPYFLSAASVPTWVWLVTAFLVFIAHTLDGTDGKQARRTKSSSALGELFDHGCDSWVCLFLSGSMFSLLGEIYTVKEMFMGQWVLIITFLLSHWEKYITGTLFLPWTFDTSQIVVALVFLFAYWLSPTIFMKPLVFGWSATVIFKFTLFFSFYFVHIPITLWNIVSTCPSKQPWHRGLGLQGVIKPLLPITLLVFTSYIWAYFSPTHLLERNTRTFLFCCGTIASNVTCHLIVAQLCHVPAPIHNKEVYLYSITTFVICFIVPISRNTSSIESIILYLISAFVTLDHIYYGYQVVNEIASCLHIKVFSITH